MNLIALLSMINTTKCLNILDIILKWFKSEKRSLEKEIDIINEIDETLTFFYLDYYYTIWTYSLADQANLIIDRKDELIKQFIDELEAYIKDVEKLMIYMGEYYIDAELIKSFKIMSREEQMDYVHRLLNMIIKRRNNRKKGIEGFKKLHEKGFVRKWRNSEDEQIREFMRFLFGKLDGSFHEMDYVIEYYDRAIRRIREEFVLQEEFIFPIE